MEVGTVEVGTAAATVEVGTVEVGTATGTVEVVTAAATAAAAAAATVEVVTAVVARATWRARRTISSVIRALQTIDATSGRVKGLTDRLSILEAFAWDGGVRQTTISVVVVLQFTA